MDAMASVVFSVEIGSTIITRLDEKIFIYIFLLHKISINITIPIRIRNKQR